VRVQWRAGVCACAVVCGGCVTSRAGAVEQAEQRVAAELRMHLRAAKARGLSSTWRAASQDTNIN
jgi:hypothetical protein